MKTRRIGVSAAVFLLWLGPVSAQPALDEMVDEMARALEAQVIEWRRHFHQNPELSNREFETAEVVAEHLKGLGLEVRTGIAHTGVVELLEGGQPGPTVALRADMDGLPVTERVDVPFASKAIGTYNGEEVGVMHACGHDTHVAILMGVAQILTEIRDDLRGSVKFIFQPAEEGAPAGEDGGAELMVKQGVLTDPGVDVIFALHIDAQRDVHSIGYRPGGIMAGAEDFRILVKGKQTHGSEPWLGIDPIVVAAQIINGLQTIISRQMPLTENAAVISVGKISGGVRSNIIPEQVEMIGTIRSLDPKMREQLHERIRRTATGIASSAGATVEVAIPLTGSAPVTYNDPELVDRMLPSLVAVAGTDNVELINAITGAEDFSFFALEVPGFYFFLGGKPVDVPMEESAAHHTPDFFIDESGFGLGVRALTRLTLDYMAAQ